MPGVRAQKGDLRTGVQVCGRNPPLANLDSRSWARPPPWWLPCPLPQTRGCLHFLPLGTQDPGHGDPQGHGDSALPGPSQLGTRTRPQALPRTPYPSQSPVPGPPGMSAWASSPSTRCSCNSGRPPSGWRQGREGRRQEGLRQRLNGIFVYFWEARLPVWGDTFGPHKAGGREQTTPALWGSPADTWGDSRTGSDGTELTRPPPSSERQRPRL